MNQPRSASCLQESSDPRETERIAGRLASSSPSGAVVGLIGPLGSGKTCFARGAAAALGIDPRKVSSPTFVYLVEYECDGGLFQHADLYRLSDLAEVHAAGAIADIGLTEAIEDARLTVVEWWEHYRGPAPHNLATVEFVIGKANHRSITIGFHGPDAAAWAAAMGARSGRE